jgi:hypothetical protein
MWYQGYRHTQTSRTGLRSQLTASQQDDNHRGNGARSCQNSYMLTQMSVPLRPDNPATRLYWVYGRNDIDFDVVPDRSTNPDHGLEEELRCSYLQVDLDPNFDMPGRPFSWMMTTMRLWCTRLNLRSLCSQQHTRNSEYMSGQRNRSEQNYVLDQKNTVGLQDSILLKFLLDERSCSIE